MLILQLIWFMMPAYFANMTPLFVRKLDFLGTPINKKLFGSHKTWRGLVLGVVVGTFVFFLQQQMNISLLSLFDYSSVSITLGILLSLGALLGDIVKSYFKRLKGINPGKPWFPFDQIDYSIGAVLLGSILYFPGLLEAFYIIVISFVLHIIVNRIGYYLGIRKLKL